MSDSDMHTSKIRLAMNAFFHVVCLMFISSWVHAEQTAGTGFTPPSTDYSVAFLANLFGVVDGVLHGTGSQMMGAIFKVFNGAVLALGGIVIMYTLIVGTMNTAHEGKMLGQKWSSIWIPIRSTIGLALLIPKSSGYCLMQVLVMWIVVQGVGAADRVWIAALEYLNAGGVVIQANMAASTSMNSDSGAISTGALAILAGEACMLGLQTQLNTQRQTYLTQQASDAGPCYGTLSSTNPMTSFCNTPVPDFLATVNAVTFQTANSTLPSFSLPMPNFDSSSPYAFLNGICGMITWNALSAATMSSIDSVSGITAQDSAATEMARATAIQQMYQDFTPVVTQMIDNDPLITVPTTNAITPAYPNLATNVFGLLYPSSGSNQAPCAAYSSDCSLWSGVSVNGQMYTAIFNGTEFQNAIADYNGIMAPTVNLINEANTSNADSNRDFIAAAEQDGWLTAGTYFFDIVWLSGSAMPSTTTDTNTGLGSSVSTPGSLQASFVTQNNIATAPLTIKASPNDCVSTGTPDYIQLCQWFNGDSTLVAAVYNLITDNAYQPGIATMPSTQVTSTTKTYTGEMASSVYGFAINSLLMPMPNQPPMAAPKFQMNLNFKMAPSLFALPSQKCSHNKGTWISDVSYWVCQGIYDDVVKNIMNYFMGIMTSIEDMVILACLGLPLALYSLVFANATAFITNPGANPLVSLANMGTSYINFSAELWLGIINLCVMSGPFIAIVAPLILISSPLLIAWTGVFVSIGFSTAYYVPFLPYMLFTFGVIGWLGAVIEAMVAAPIVALGVTHPEGEGALGKADQAIMILMNVFLRPSMMVIGFLMGISLCYVSIWVLNTGFGHVMQFIQGTPVSGTTTTSSTPWKGGDGYNNWAGLYGFFFSILFYTSLYLTLAQKAFNLIYTLPDHIMTWIGGPASQVGQETAQWGEDTKQKMTEAGGKALDAQGQVGKKVKGAATDAAAIAATAEGGPEAGAAVKAVGDAI